MMGVLIQNRLEAKLEPIHLRQAIAALTQIHLLLHEDLVYQCLAEAEINLKKTTN